MPSSNLDIEVTLGNIYSLYFTEITQAKYSKTIFANTPFITGEHDTRYREKELKLTATYKVHNDYALDQREGGYLINDFALLKLSSRVDFARYPHIRPICLPERGFTDYDNERGTVTGWGRTQVEYFKRNGLVKGVGSSASNTLQKLDMK